MDVWELHIISREPLSKDLSAYVRRGSEAVEGGKSSGRV